MRYSFECLIRGLFGMFSTFFEFDSDVADAWKDFSLHVVANHDVDGVILVEVIQVDGKVVLVITDSLTCCHAILIDEVALDGIELDDLFPMGDFLGLMALDTHDLQLVSFFLLLLALLIREDFLLYDQRDAHERIGTRDAQAQILLIEPGGGQWRNGKRECVVLLPSSNRSVGIFVIYR